MCCHIHNPTMDIWIKLSLLSFEGSSATGTAAVWFLVLRRKVALSIRDLTRGQQRSLWYGGEVKA